MTVDQHDTTRLRDALDAVASRHQPDPDAWLRIQEGLGAPADLVPVDADASPHRRRWRAVLSAAAVVVLFVAAVAVIRSGRPDESTVATTPEGEATGWYVPVGLPDGWKVEWVAAQRWDRRCPCRTASWANEDRSVAIRAVSEATPETDDGITIPSDNETTFALDDETEASLNHPDDGTGYWDVFWEADGRYQSIAAIGVPVDQAEAVARALFADPATEVLPVDGLDLTDGWTEPGPVGRDARVEVRLRTPAGRAVEYTLLSERGAADFAMAFRPTTHLADRQPLPLLRPVPLDELADPPTAGRARDYLGPWPGATVRVLSSYSDAGTTTTEEIEAVVAALRPVDLARWRAFVATAPTRDRAATASATFADLAEDRAGPAPSTPDPAQGDVADLDLTLEAISSLESWADPSAVLEVHNPTDDTITDPTCRLDGAQIAMLPADDATRSAVAAISDGDPWWSDRGSCDGGLELAPGRSTSIRLPIRQQFLDARLGPLPSGRYDLTVRIDGLAEQPTSTIDVTGPACGAGDADYVGRTGAEARALADERDQQVRIPAAGVDSEVSVDNCSRINLIIDDGRVTFARSY